MRLKSVVLPAPFGPITLTISCSRTTRSSSAITRRPPKDLSLPAARAALSRSSNDLDSCGAEEALRPNVHQRNEQRSKQDESRRPADLDEQQILPDEHHQV